MIFNSPEFKEKVAAQAEQQRIDRIRQRGLEIQADKLVHDLVRNRDRAERVLDLAAEVADIAFGTVNLEVNLVEIKDRRFYKAHKLIAQGWVIDQNIIRGGNDGGLWYHPTFNETALGNDGNIYEYSYHAEKPLRYIEQTFRFTSPTEEDLKHNPEQIDQIELCLAAFVARCGLKEG